MPHGIGLIVTHQSAFLGDAADEPQHQQREGQDEEQNRQPLWVTVTMKLPAKVIPIRDIPRTRSGKIVEIAVRDLIHHRPIDNLEALANPEALEAFNDLPELLEE